MAETSVVRILLVDDSFISRKLLSKFFLKHAGRTHAKYEVTTAINGAEAVAAEAVNSFDVIFMDSSLPVMDGFQATQKIRERESRTQSRRSLICIKSPDSRLAVRDLARNAGADAFLGMPISLQEIAKVVEQAIENVNKRATKLLEGSWVL